MYEMPVTKWIITSYTIFMVHYFEPNFIGPGSLLGHRYYTILFILAQFLIGPLQLFVQILIGPL